MAVTVTHVDVDVPLFVLFRALGVESDRAILQHVVYDPDAPEEADVVEFLRACVLEAGSKGIYDQRAAIDFMVPHTRFKTELDLKSVLADDLFPNIGREFSAKALMLGHVTRRIVRVALGKEPVSVLDDYANKRIDLTGHLLGDLFRDVFTVLRDRCLGGMNAEYNAGAWKTSGDLRALVNTANIRALLPAHMVRDNMVRAMKGAWGVDDGDKDDDAESGKVQDLSRVSYLLYASHVRRVAVCTVISVLVIIFGSSFTTS